MTDPRSPAALRAKLAAHKAAPPAPGKIIPPQGGSVTAKPKAEPQPSPALVTYACAHTRPVASFKGEPCGSCREAKRQAKMKARRERQAAQKPPSVPDAGKCERDGRLPDGAAFAVVYDAAKVEWRGSLTLPDGRAFVGTASGVERLLRDLGRKCREPGTPAEDAV